MLILTVLILVIAGCGVQIRNKANLAINNLRNKIDKVRVEH
jgi:outer membrane lipopolysaccharide assembly protein LptE/RlpB